MRGALLLAALALVGTAAQARAQAPRTHVLLVTGLSAEPQYAATFARAANRIFDAAKSRWKVADSDLVYLAERPTSDPTRIRGVSSRAEVEKAFAAMVSRTQPGDVVLVVLIGHGAGEREGSKVNLTGPDPTATDYQLWLGLPSRATVVFVNASSGSGDFLPVLSAKNRIVITATKSAMERNESLFAEQFSLGLTSDSADADKDGRNSVLEAYSYARAQVAKAYESTGRLQTEHAQLDDDGDGKGTAEPGAAGATDGALAAQVAFGATAVITDPRVIALIGERRELEQQVAALRARKATTDSVSYERELERLLIAIAEKTQAIQKLQPGGHQ